MKFNLQANARLLRRRTFGAASLAWRAGRSILGLATRTPRRLIVKLLGAGRKLYDLDGEYRRWIVLYDTMSKADKAAMSQRLQSLSLRPLISVVMPVHDTPETLLRKAIESVRAQIYDRWELCIADDGSTATHVRRLLDGYAARDPRIRVCFRPTNGGIVEASNAALTLAGGEFVALLDHDDELAPHALAQVAEAIAAQPDLDLIYSDEDKLDEKGRRYAPYFKPDWNPALMLSQNMFCHLGVYRRSLVQKVGGFRAGFDGSQDHDLVLRCARATTAARIHHIPRILYHWRAVGTSTAAAAGIKPYAWEAGRRAIADHLAQMKIHAEVGPAAHAPVFYQVEYEVPQPRPRVSILIPTTGAPELLRPCLESILARASYENFEILLLVEDKQRAVADRADCLDWAARQPRVRVLSYAERPFNFSWVNNWAAGQASGEILCLLNDDTEIITPDWLEKLVARISLDGVGAVGPMLYYSDRSIQHAGVILGMGGVAAHAFSHAPHGSHGYFGRACLEQDLSCVTAGCMALRKSTFDAVGGFDEELAVAFNDVDFCIRLRAAGWRIVWTPAVELYHRESASIGHFASPQRVAQFGEEVARMRQRWGALLDCDPHYNVNLSLQHQYGLAFPPLRRHLCRGARGL